MSNIGLLETDRLSVVRIFRNERQIDIPDRYPEGARGHKIPMTWAVRASDEDLGVFFLARIEDARPRATPFRNVANERIEHDGTRWVQRADLAEVDVGAAKARLLNDVERKASSVIAGGTSFAGAPIDTSAEFATMINFIANARGVGTPWPSAGVPVKARDGRRVRVQETEFNGMVQALAAHYTAALENKAAHEDAIGVLTTIAELEAYDISTGWPANPTPRMRER